MHPADNSRGLRRGTAFVGLAVLLGVVTLTLSQCRMVDDRITGVTFGRNNPSNCFSACSRTYNDSIRVEAQRHVDTVQGCAGDPVCLAMEEIRHEAAVDRIQAGRQTCQDNCHHQGRGGGR